MKSIKELAHEALCVQDACNLTGVAIAFARAMVNLRETLEFQKEGIGSDDVRFHPITTVWVDKMASLADVQSLGHERCMRAFDEVSKLAE